MDVGESAVRPSDLAQQQGAAVPQLRNEVPELVARVGHRQGRGALGYPVAGQDGRRVRRGKAGVRQPEFLAQRPVKDDQCRV